MATPSGLYPAMAKAFAAMEGAKKDSENEAFKRNGKATKYADLESVVAAIKPALIANDLFFAQVAHEQQGGVCIETVVHHISGESMSFGKVFVPASKNDAHGYGSATSYARRYGLMTAFGICPEDDDGNAAVAAQASVKMITPAQVKELKQLAKDVGANEQGFFDWCNVASWEHIPAQNYMDARNALEAKRSKAKADPQRSEELDDTVPHMGN